jgi:hypothetical protein
VLVVVQQLQLLLREMMLCRYQMRKRKVVLGKRGSSDLQCGMILLRCVLMEYGRLNVIIAARSFLAF